MSFLSLFGGNKNKPDGANMTTTSNSTQAWFPVHDVYNSFMFRKDNYLIKAIEVEPNNIEILGESGKTRNIKQLHEVFSGIDYDHQIISIPRPVDLDAFIQDYEAIKADAPTLLKQRLLSGYIRQAVTTATSGEATDRHFYFLIGIPRSNKPHADEELLSARARDLAESLTNAGLAARICDDDELRMILFIFTNPVQAAYERQPFSSLQLPSLYEEGLDDE